MGSKLLLVVGDGQMAFLQRFDGKGVAVVAFESRCTLAMLHCDCTSELAEGKLFVAADYKHCTVEVAGRGRTY